MGTILYNNLIPEYDENGNASGVMETHQIEFVTEMDYYAERIVGTRTFLKKELPCLCFWVLDRDISSELGEKVMKVALQIKLDKKQARVIENFIDGEI